MENLAKAEFAAVDFGQSVICDVHHLQMMLPKFLRSRAKVRGASFFPPVPNRVRVRHQFPVSLSREFSLRYSGPSSDCSVQFPLKSLFPNETRSDRGICNPSPSCKCRGLLILRPI